LKADVTIHNERGGRGWRRGGDKGGSHDWIDDVTGTGGVEGMMWKK
jgi:hypothetical protein